MLTSSYILGGFKNLKHVRFSSYDLRAPFGFSNEGITQFAMIFVSATTTFRYIYLEVS